MGITLSGKSGKVVVQSVAPTDAAAIAGLKKGDVISALKGGNLNWVAAKGATAETAIDLINTCSGEIEVEYLSAVGKKKSR